LCSELRAKARYSESGVIIDHKEVEAALKRLLKDTLQSSDGPTATIKSSDSPLGGVDQIIREGQDWQFASTEPPVNPLPAPVDSTMDTQMNSPSNRPTQDTEDGDTGGEETPPRQRTPDARAENFPDDLDATATTGSPEISPVFAYTVEACVGNSGAFAEARLGLTSHAMVMHLNAQLRWHYRSIDRIEVYRNRLEIFGHGTILRVRTSSWETIKDIVDALAGIWPELEVGVVLTFSWDSSELTELEAAVARFGTDWTAVSNYLRTKDAAAVEKRYQYLVVNGSSDLQSAAREADLRRARSEKKTDSPDSGASKEPALDRWAQIRANASERAARDNDKRAHRSRDDSPERVDDGETSGEETIESRVARIKKRVAELTGNAAAEPQNMPDPTMNGGYFNSIYDEMVAWDPNRPSDDIVEERFRSIIREQGWHDLPEASVKKMAAYNADFKWSIVRHIELNGVTHDEFAKANAEHLASRSRGAYVEERPAVEFDDSMSYSDSRMSSKMESKTLQARLDDIEDMLVTLGGADVPTNAQRPYSDDGALSDRIEFPGIPGLFQPARPSHQPPDADQMPAAVTATTVRGLEFVHMLMSSRADDGRPIAPDFYATQYSDGIRRPGLLVRQPHTLTSIEDKLKRSMYHNLDQVLDDFLHLTLDLKAHSDKSTIVYRDAERLEREAFVWMKSHRDAHRVSNMSAGSSIYPDRDAGAPNETGGEGSFDEHAEIIVQEEARGISPKDDRLGGNNEGTASDDERATIEEERPRLQPPHVDQDDVSGAPLVAASTFHSGETAHEEARILHDLEDGDLSEKDLGSNEQIQPKKSFLADLSTGTEPAKSSLDVDAMRELNTQDTPVVGSETLSNIREHLRKTMERTQMSTRNAMEQGERDREASREMTLDAKRTALEDAMARTIINGGNSFKAAAGQ
jgi:hypothetical protein